MCHLVDWNVKNEKKLDGYAGPLLSESRVEFPNTASSLLNVLSTVNSTN